MNHYCYFLLPHPPASRPHKLWFASWSQDQARLEWTAEPPSRHDPGAPWIVCAQLDLEDVPPPAGATLLARYTTAIKDVPPPPDLLATEVEGKGFPAAFAESLETMTVKRFTPP